MASRLASHDRASSSASRTSLGIGVVLVDRRLDEPKDDLMLVAAPTACASVWSIRAMLRGPASRNASRICASEPTGQASIAGKTAVKPLVSIAFRSL